MRILLVSAPPGPARLEFGRALAAVLAGDLYVLGDLPLWLAANAYGTEVPETDAPCARMNGAVPSVAAAAMRTYLRTVHGESYLGKELAAYVADCGPSDGWLVVPDVELVGDCLPLLAASSVGTVKLVHLVGEQEFRHLNLELFAVPTIPAYSSSGAGWARQAAEGLAARLST